MVTSPTRTKSEKTLRKLHRASRKEPSTPEVPNAPRSVSFPIAVVGASAGGLEAFTALLKALPDDTGAGFVLIHHLEPTHESALTRILSRNTLMPIREVVDGVAVEQNHVYVIPPNKNMILRQGILRLAPREEASGPHRPIDGFAMALAEEHRSIAIGIVLSGTGFEVDNEFAGLGRRQYLINACQISRDNDTADMILIAFEDITVYKKTEVLRQSASTLRALIESSPQAILAVSGDGKITQANDITEKVFGYSPSELLGQPIEMLISENLKDRHAGLRKDFFFDPRTGPVGITREIEGRRKDATQIQIEITLGYIDTLEGKLAAAFVTDITHRKMLERISETSRQKISALAASLLRAQENERRRVSRELHDTLCQQLASLAFDVGDLAAQTSPSDVAHRHLRKIQARVVKMSEEARHIAYQLHPSELDDLGLNAALQALCDEVSKRRRITIKVASNDVSEQLPLEVASCLYRVYQEGSE